LSRDVQIRATPLAYGVPTSVGELSGISDEVSGLRGCIHWNLQPLSHSRQPPLKSGTPYGNRPLRRTEFLL